MTTYYLDGYNVTADNREEALDLLLETVNTGEPVAGVAWAHTGYRGHFTGAWVCDKCGPLCIASDYDTEED